MTALLVAAAQARAGTTDTAMPNAQPPRRRPTRANATLTRRPAGSAAFARPQPDTVLPVHLTAALPLGRAGERSARGRPRTSGGADAGTRVHDSTVATAPGVPSGWAGALELMTTVEPRLPGPAALLSPATLAAIRPERATADLSSLWNQNADTGAARPRFSVRRLDVKGRLKLPINPASAARLSVVRAGAVLTVHLTDSTGGVVRGRPVAPLPMDTRGRLTITENVRAELGLPNGADVMIMLDPDQRLPHICAASRLDDTVASGLDELRADAPSSSRTSGPAGPSRAASPTSGHVVAASDAATVSVLTNRRDSGARHTGRGDAAVSQPPALTAQPGP